MVNIERNGGKYETEKDHLRSADGGNLLIVYAVCGFCGEKIIILDDGLRVRPKHHGRLESRKHA